MSTKTEQIARSATGALSSDADFLLACTWANERYQQLVSRVRFKHLRRIGEFVAPGAYTTGTVSITTGTNVVSGVGTAFDSSLVGRHFRGANSWYRIAAVASPLSLRLDSTYTEATLSASAFVIAARFVTVEGRWLGQQIVMARTREPFKAIPFDAFETAFPGRLFQHSSRLFGWTEVGSALDASGEKKKLIELYPALSTSELFTYVYFDLPEDIKDPESVIPPEIDLYILKEGVLIDVMRHEMAKALREGKAEAAAHWRNEYRAQSSSWERNIIEAIRADKGVDDATFIMRSLTPRFAGDITNARDEVRVRGNFP